jgi:molecular chaperone DnaK
VGRNTIDYGIDLGTTNSVVAVLTGTQTEVIGREDGSVTTPSAIYFDKRGHIYTGAKAKANYFYDEENGAVEFKLRMGEKWRKSFQRTGREMLPEEMSAEVLKSLKENVRSMKGEELEAAVITVPAAFELPQNEATRRAAELVGLRTSPLLQEPIAAALAYGFQSAANKVFWLVYDFGGGTFDAAIIQVRDGVLQVVNHVGHNYLGGKNVDWDIVDKMLVPKLTAERRVSGLNRQNSKWRTAIAKLKYHAEEAKIQVSRTRKSHEIWIENLCVDDAGAPIDFLFELTPAILQQIIEPWVVQSINLTNRALDEKALSRQDIEKCILVGGSSLFPWLQERVSAELGLPIDFSIDPMTVVARGAAVFAGTQRLQASWVPAQSGSYNIELDYEPVGGTTEPLVGGRVSAPPGKNTAGLSVEIIETRSQWTSGRIRLSDSGTFLTEVRAERGRKCEFEILLTDSRGTGLLCLPDRFPYTVGVVITSPPLTHSVGVAMANNQMDVFFHKGDPLPARKTKVHHAAVPLRKNAAPGPDNVIRIAMVEGESTRRADRNRAIGYLEILPTDPRVRRDVPIGSEVEITIDIDASRTAKSKVFIPILDEEFEGVFKPEISPRTTDELRDDLAGEIERLGSLNIKAEQMDDETARAALERLEKEQVLETAKRQVSVAVVDPEARAEADRKLLDLKSAIDGVGDALEWPMLVQSTREQIDLSRREVNAHGTPTEHESMLTLEGAIDEAIEQHRIDVLREKVEEVRDLGFQVLIRQPDFWVGYLEYLKEQRPHMSDSTAADRLFTQAGRALNNNDLEALKASVRQLIGLLPPDEREEAEARGSFGGTTIRR